MAATTIEKKKQILWSLCKPPSLRMFEKKDKSIYVNPKLKIEHVLRNL